MVDKDELTQARITAFWDEVAPEYESRPGNLPTFGSAEYAAWVDAVASCLPKTPSDVLDVGTGTGFVALMAAAIGHRVTGVDLSSGMLDVARRHAKDRGLDVTFLIGDAVEPPVTAESFDVVANRNLIWTLRDLPRAFTNWKRALRPHGRLVAIYGLGSALPPPGPAREFFDRFYSSEVQAAIPSLHAMDHDLLKEAAEHAGFNSIEFADLPVPEGPDGGAFVLTAIRQ